jgi:hypothetical protein
MDRLGPRFKIQNPTQVIFQRREANMQRYAAGLARWSRGKLNSPSVTGLIDRRGVNSHPWMITWELRSRRGVCAAHESNCCGHRVNIGNLILEDKSQQAQYYHMLEQKINRNLTEEMGVRAIKRADPRIRPRMSIYKNFVLHLPFKNWFVYRFVMLGQNWDITVIRQTHW